MRNDVLKRIAGPGFSILFVCFAFFDVLLPGRVLALGEHTETQRATWWWWRHEILAGRLPTLTWASPEGVPYEQELRAGFTPLSLLFVIVRDFDVAYDLFIVGSYFLLALGTFALANRLKATREGAFLAAGIAALSGPALSLDVDTASLVSASWIPIVGVLWLDLQARPDARRMALLAMALSFHLQGLSWTLVCTDGLLIAAAMLFRASTPSSKGRWLTLASLGLGAMIAAVAMYPALMAASRSEAPRKLETFAVSLPLLSELLGPSIFAPPDLPFAELREVTEQRGLYTHWSPNNFKSFYLGSALPLLVMFGLKPRDRKISALLVFAAIFFITAGTPLFGLIRLQHPLDHGVDVGHTSIPFVAMLAVFAPMALERAVAVPLRLAIGATVHVGVVVGLTNTVLSEEFRSYLSLAITEGNPTYRSLMVAPYDFLLSSVYERSGQSIEDLAMGAMAARLVHGSVFAVLVLFLALLIAAKRLPRPSAMLAGVIVFDLALGARFTIFGAPTEELAANHAVLESMTDAKTRVFAFRPRGYATEISLDGRTFAEAELVSKARRAEFNFDIPDFRTLRVGSAHPRGNGLSRRLVELTRRTTDDRLWPLLSRMGVRFMTSTFQAFHSEFWLSAVLHAPGEAPEFVFEWPHARPHSEAFASWWKVNPATTSDAQLRLLLEFLQDDTTLLFVEDAPPAPEHVIDGTCQGPDRAPTKIVEVSFAVGRVELDVEGVCDALVITREFYARGWTATLDAKPHSVQVADLGFVGAFVPKGRHRLVLAFEPSSASALPFSILGWCIALLCVALPRRSRL